MMYSLLLALFIRSSKCISQLQGLSWNVMPRIFNQVFASYHSINRRVSQESVLGPILFSITANDIIPVSLI